MRFVMYVNNDEAVGNGDDLSFDEVKDEVEELLRSGYYGVEYMREFKAE